MGDGTQNRSGDWRSSRMAVGERRKPSRTIIRRENSLMSPSKRSRSPPGPGPWPWLELELELELEWEPGESMGNRISTF